MSSSVGSLDSPDVGIWEFEQLGTDVGECGERNQDFPDRGRIWGTAEGRKGRGQWSVVSGQSNGGWGLERRAAFAGEGC